MGYTQYTKHKLDTWISPGKSIIDLGSQNDYSGPVPAPYISEWYAKKRMAYACIDLNGENGALTHDLAIIQDYKPEFDLVVDAGTSEHVGVNGEFSWEGLYNCWLNKFNLCKQGGYIHSENPQTASWPLHGFNYYTAEFYYQLAAACDMAIMMIELYPAMNNTRNGWNVCCTLWKQGPKFLDLDTFKTFDLRQS